MNRALLFSATALVVLVLFGSVQYSPGDSLVETPQVVIPTDAGTDQSLNFQPSLLHLVLGVNNTVVWVNDDTTQHLVTSTGVPLGAQGFESGVLSPGQTFTTAFTVPGTYSYSCKMHPGWMKGTIVVTN